MEHPEDPRTPENIPEPAGGFPVQPGEREESLPPSPRPRKSPFQKAVHAVALVAVVAVGLFIISAFTGRPGHGATQSHRDRAEERRQLIESAAQGDVLAGTQDLERKPNVE